MNDIIFIHDNSVYDISMIMAIGLFKIQFKVYFFWQPDEPMSAGNIFTISTISAT